MLIPDSVLQRQRRCVGVFMDENEAFFGISRSGGNWSQLIDSMATPEDSDRLNMERALGVILNVFRAASFGVGGMDALQRWLPAEDAAGVELIPPHQVSMQAFDVDGSPEARAFARGMTVYLRLLERGEVREHELDATLVGMLDGVPAETSFMQSAIEAAKAFALIQLDYLLGRESV